MFQIFDLKTEVILRIVLFNRMERKSEKRSRFFSEVKLQELGSQTQLRKVQYLHVVNESFSFTGFFVLNEYSQFEKSPRNSGSVTCEGKRGLELVVHGEGDVAILDGQVSHLEGQR